MHNLSSLHAQEQAPCSSTSLTGQVSFIMNNLTTANLSTKIPELQTLLPIEHWTWFCNYLVVRRAAQVCPVLPHKNILHDHAGRPGHGFWDL